MTNSCSCGFDPESVWPTHSSVWHRRHMEYHINQYPNLDENSKRNLQMKVDMAEEREAW